MILWNTEGLNGEILQVLTPKEVRERLDRDGIVLIDMCTPFENGFEHARGAPLLPMSSYDPGEMPCQTGKPIVFHCGSGMRFHAIADRSTARDQR